MIFSRGDAEDAEDAEEGYKKRESRLHGNDGRRRV
jgi:hypothetical protein